MTLRMTLAVALTAAGLASSASAQVYIDPVHGTATVGSTSYYYTPGTGITYGSTGYVTPGSYTYTTPTTGWYQSGYTYPSTAYSYPSYGTMYNTTSGYTYNGATYPSYVGSNYYYPAYNNGYYTNGYTNSVTGYPYNTYNIGQRWFRR